MTNPAEKKREEIRESAEMMPEDGNAAVAHVDGVEDRALYIDGRR
jgi:ribosomal protein L10